MPVVDTISKTRKRHNWSRTKIVRYILPNYVNRALNIVREVGGAYMFNYNKNLMFMNQEQYDKMNEEHIRMVVVKV